MRTIIAVMVVLCLAAGVAASEDYLKMRANSTTVEIRNISPYDLDIGNLKIYDTNGAQRVLAETGPILLYNNSSYFQKNVTGLYSGANLILSSNGFTVYAMCTAQ